MGSGTDSSVFTRRSFIKGAGVFTVAGMLAGCAPQVSNLEKAETSGSEAKSSSGSAKELAPTEVPRDEIFADVSKAIEGREYELLMEDAGTGPQIYYLK